VTLDNIAEKKGAGRRRSERFRVRIPVEVRTQTDDVKNVSEKTDALRVNAHGGLVLLAMKVKLDQVVSIVNLKTGDGRLSRVTTLGPNFLGKTEVGIEFISPSPEFWGVRAIPK